MSIRQLLAHPLAKNLDIDAPETIEIHRQIILSKPLLLSIYREWYELLYASIPDIKGEVLEVGSRTGLIKYFLPEIITSDIADSSLVQLVTNGQSLPFGDAFLRGIIMTNVLHHIQKPELFLNEAARCVKKGGVIAMVEPWANPWSSFIYKRLHHEPYQPEAERWELAEGGFMSSANGALPWIMFKRDRKRFETAHSSWEIVRIAPLMPITYLLSGGVSTRCLMPAGSFRLLRLLESPLDHVAGMFALIVLKRR